MPVSIYFWVIFSRLTSLFGMKSVTLWKIEFYSKKYSKSHYFRRSRLKILDGIELQFWVQVGPFNRKDYNRINDVASYEKNRFFWKCDDGLNEEKFQEVKRNIGISIDFIPTWFTQHSKNENCLVHNRMHCMCQPKYRPSNKVLCTMHIYIDGNINNFCVRTWEKVPCFYECTLLCIERVKHIETLDPSFNRE